MFSISQGIRPYEQFVMVDQETGRAQLLHVAKKLHQHVVLAIEQMRANLGPEEAIPADHPD